MRSRLAPFALLFCGLLLAGCLASESEPSPPPVTVPDDGADTGASAGVTLADCRQHHTYYRNPVQPFQRFIPEGFRVQTNDPTGATFDLRVDTNLCANESEFWVGLPVIPPEDLRVEGARVHLVPVVAHLAGDTLTALYNESGFGAHLRVGRFSVSTTSINPSGYTDKVQVDGDGERYEQTTVLRPSGAPWPEEIIVRYAVAEGKVVGRVVAFNGNGTQIGAGTVELTYSGNGGAPPASTGIAHGVQGLPVTLRFERLA